MNYQRRDSTHMRDHARSLMPLAPSPEHPAVSLALWIVIIVAGIVAAVVWA